MSDHLVEHLQRNGQPLLRIGSSMFPKLGFATREDLLAGGLGPAGAKTLFDQRTIENVRRLERLRTEIVLDQPTIDLVVRVCQGLSRNEPTLLEGPPATAKTIGAELAARSLGLRVTKGSGSSVQGKGTTMSDKIFAGDQVTNEPPNMLDQLGLFLQGAKQFVTIYNRRQSAAVPAPRASSRAPAAANAGATRPPAVPFAVGVGADPRPTVPFARHTASAAGVVDLDNGGKKEVDVAVGPPGHLGAGAGPAGDCLPNGPPVVNALARTGWMVHEAVDPALARRAAKAWAKVRARTKKAHAKTAQGPCPTPSVNAGGGEPCAPPSAAPTSAAAGLPNDGGTDSEKPSPPTAGPAVEAEPLPPEGPAADPDPPVALPVEELPPTSMPQSAESCSPARMAREVEPSAPPDDLEPVISAVGSPTASTPTRSWTPSISRPRSRRSRSLPRPRRPPQQSSSPPRPPRTTRRRRPRRPPRPGRRPARAAPPRATLTLPPLTISPPS